MFQGRSHSNRGIDLPQGGTDQQEYLKYTFSDVLVSSYQAGGSGGSGVIPTEQVSLNYSKMEIEYKEQKKDGTLGGAIKAGYDLKQMTPC